MGSTAPKRFRGQEQGITFGVDHTDVDLVEEGVQVRDLLVAY
jgi:hypothetical protein